MEFFAKKFFKKMKKSGNLARKMLSISEEAGGIASGNKLFTINKLRRI